jgi:hypothetical protein
MNTIEERSNPPMEPEIIKIEEANGDAKLAPVPPQLPREPPPGAPASYSGQRNVLSFTLVTAVALGLVYWKRELLRGSVPYVPVVIPSLIALVQFLFKDRDSYKPRWSRWVLLAFIVLAGTWGFIYQGQQIADKAASGARADAAQKSQDQNTKSFLASLKDLSSQVNDLKTKVTTKDLRDQLTIVNGELEKTRSALAGPPPVDLAVSLLPFDVAMHGGPVLVVKDVRLPLDSDGVVHVPFFVYNPADRTASNGELTLVICPQCKYAKEPLGFTKLAADKEPRRLIGFSQLLPTTEILDLSVDVIPPDAVESIPIWVIVKCANCVAPKVGVTLAVHLARDFVKPFPARVAAPKH